MNNTDSKLFMNRKVSIMLKEDVFWRDGCGSRYRLARLAKSKLLIVGMQSALEK